MTLLLRVCHTLMSRTVQIKRYARRAHQRLSEIHNLRMQDGESCSSFMDRFIHIAGHDWETNRYKRRELYNAFMNAVPDQLH